MQPTALAIKISRFYIQSLAQVGRFFSLLLCVVCYLRATIDVDPTAAVGLTALAPPMGNMLSTLHPLKQRASLDY